MADANAAETQTQAPEQDRPAEETSPPAEAQAVEQKSDAQETNTVEAQEVQLPQAHDQHPRPANGQMDLLLDVTVKVQVCLGEVQTQVRDLLQLNTGSVVTLDRQVGEPVDLFLRGTRFATGNLVVVGEHLGIRIREILTPETPVEGQ